MSPLFFGALVLLTVLSLRGCTISQNQDNAPISVVNSQGRTVLSVTCSADGSVAYVTDGQNVYRYSPNAATDDWQCILSHRERLALAHRHDPCEPSADKP